MPRVREVPITGEVLRWAIDESGWQRAALAEKLKISPETLLNWETGKERPGQTQFNEIVRHLKRPSAVFFLPEPPPADNIPSAFRSLNGPSVSLGPEERRHLRDAVRMQNEISAIKQDLNYAEVELYPATITDSPEEVALDERRRSGVTVETQLAWKSDSEAFNEWRAVLESKGILVFLQQIGHGNMRGYAIRDEYAPLIGLNSTGFNTTSRIFSMLHEYAHLLLTQDDVTYEQESPQTQSQSEIERWCEGFAAAFLIPRDELEALLIDEYGWRPGFTVALNEAKSILGRLANKFKVSLRAMALRLQQVGFAPRSLYESLGAQPPRSGGGGGQPRADRAMRRYGTPTMSFLREALDHDIIGIEDILDLLGITLDDWSLLDLELAAA